VSGCLSPLEFVFVHPGVNVGEQVVALAEDDTLAPRTRIFLLVAVGRPGGRRGGLRVV
jgi:hypothetical protein